MRKILFASLVLAFLVALAQRPCFAEEKAVSTVSVPEHGSIQLDDSLKTNIWQAMKAYADEQARKGKGFFELLDPKTRKKRKLRLLRIHEKVGKTGKYYYSRADFQDSETFEIVDVDIDVQVKGNEVTVVDAVLHNVGPEWYYHYDARGKRIPVK